MTAEGQGGFPAIIEASLPTHLDYYDILQRFHVTCCLNKVNLIYLLPSRGPGLSSTSPDMMSC